MNKNFTKTVCCIAAGMLLFLSSFRGEAQQFRVVESGNYLTALAKDNLGNLYTARYNGGNDRYDIVKYNSSATSSSVIYSGLHYDGTDYVWGIAVDSHGNVFVAASNVDNKVIKLTYNSGTDSYSPSDYITGKYCSSLAIDGSDNLYTTEYNAGADKYQLVRYNAGSNTGETVLYGTINLGANYAYPTSIVIAPNNDIYFNLAYGNSSSPDQGGVLKITAASGYTAVSTISTGKYSTAAGLDEQGNLYVSEYNAGSDSYVLNKYTGATGTPTSLYTLDYGVNFYPWGLVVNNSKNIYFITGSSDAHPGGALVQLYALPVSQSTNITASGQTMTAANLNWTSGSGEKRLVFMAEANAGQPSVSNNTTYAANPSFGSGAKDVSGNWSCVYNGNGNSTTVTNLQADHTYRVMVLDYNGNPGLEQYQTVTATGNPVNISAATVSSIVRADADNSFASTLHYTVTFGSPVSGLSAANFSLTTGPYITGATIDAVTSVSGVAYTVTVHKSAGSGDLTLNLANAGGVSSPIVSTLPFVGETYHLNTTEVDLSDLVPGEGTLSPVFSANTTSYSLTVSQPSLVLTPTAVSPTSTITVNGQAVTSGSVSAPIALNEGANTIEVIVTSGSSALSKTYTLSVTYDKSLPVTWVNFDVGYQGGKYNWNWQLGVQTQVAYYVPEYSLDGQSYQDAGKVSENDEQHSYHFSKALDLQGLAYFRVKAVNNDGSASYSDIKTLSSNAADAAMILYPNPVGGQLHLKWPGTAATTLDITVYSTVGKKVLQQKLSNAPVVTLQVGGLAAGSYYLVVEDNQHRRIQSSLFLKK